MKLVRLLAYLLLCALILAASTAAAGWLAWEAILYLIRHSQ